MAKFRLHDLNSDPINQAILDCDLPDYYTDSAAASAMCALETYASADSDGFRIVGVEQEFEETLDFWPFKFKWVADLIAYNPSQIIIVDWKVTTNPDKRWEAKIVDSWQWRLYSYFIQKRFPKMNVKFLYRGIPRAGSGKPRQVALTSASSYWNYQIGKVPLYLRQSAAFLESLREAERWPEYRPSGCGAFGRDCPFMTGCLSTGTPTGVLKLEHLSHSTLDKLALCPERLRLSKLTGTEEDGMALQVGKAAHAAIAAAYMQIRDWQIATGFNTGKELSL